MPNFVWSVRDRFGAQAIREINAATSEESRQILLAEGCTELVLKADEISDAVMAGISTKKFLGEEIKTTAEQRLKYRNKPPYTFSRALAEGVKQSKGILALIVAVGIFAAYDRNEISIALAGIALLAWMTFLVCIRLPSIYYRRLVKAEEWHQWDEVFRLTRMLDRIGKIHFSKLSAASLARFRTKAMAGTGHLEQALQEFKQYKDQPGCPGWLHTALTGSLYDLAKQHDKGLECNLAALREKPGSALYLDLANRYARYKGDPAKAREALAAAEKFPVTELASSFHLRCKGIVAYLERDYSSAKRDLEGAIRMMEQTPHVVYRTGRISIAKAYLCCVLAKQGDSEPAKKNFEAARKYLEATNEIELINECKAEIEKK